MRIGFAIYGALDRVSGGFAYDRALIDQLVALGHEVEVLSLPWFGYGRALASNLSPPPPMAKDRRPCDVIVEDELIHPTLLRGRTFWRRRQTLSPGGAPPPPAAAIPPRVALVHNLRSRQPGESVAALKAAVERRYLRGVDGVIAVCADTLATARALMEQSRSMPRMRSLPQAPTAAMVAHPGRDHLEPCTPMDPAFLAARSAMEGPLRVLHVAAVTPNKGLHRLLGILAQSPRARFRLDVVGSLAGQPRYVRALQQQADRDGIAGSVHWHGEQHGDALRNLYRDSQLFALPSDREAYSLACLEAQAFGLPVLATARGGLAEMFPNRDAGFLIDPADYCAWSAALQHLAADRAHLTSMAVGALANHRRHRTWREVASSVQEFLAQVVDRSRSTNHE